MNDTAVLQIKVDTEGFPQAIDQIDGINVKGKQAERATDGLAASFKRIAGPLAAFVSVAKLVNDSLSVQRRYDQLSSTLETVTGSAENASMVFKTLQEYADRTPFAIENLNEAFIKLVNYGLDPSERALTSYGNTATSLGKDITDMVNAVASATTGSFDSLQSFGIRAQNMGDQVSFSFRGTTTVVKNSAKDIEEYLLGLGENDFAGAMENSLGKLDDTILGLGEQYETLLLNIMQAGIGEKIQAGIMVGVDALYELNQMLASGELQERLSAITLQFDDWGKDVSESVTILRNFMSEAFAAMGDDGEESAQRVIDAFRLMPTNIRTFVQIVATEFAVMVDQIDADTTFIMAAIKAPFTSGTLAEARRNLSDHYDRISQTRLESISSILEERDATIAASDAAIEKARELRAEYDRLQEERLASGEDRLAQFRIEGDGGGSKTDAAAVKKQKADFDRLVDSLRTQEEAIQDSYDRRLLIITQNTSAESQLRMDLVDRLNQSHAKELEDFEKTKGQEVEVIRASMLSQEESIEESYDRRMKILRDNLGEESELRADLELKLAEQREKQLADLETSRQRERDSLWNSLLTEEEMIAQSYERKKELILESELVMEEERQELLRRLEEQYAQEQYDMEMKRIGTQLSNAELLFDGLAGLAKGYAGEQSTAYRALFAVSKAFSIAQAGMSIATGIAKAQELGFPANLAEMARVGATAASIVPQITGASFDGGGFTGYGPRAGGTDGKGGFLATLHPNETVIDHTKGQRAMGGVTNNFIVQGTPDRRTQEQVAQKAASSQRRVQARFGNVYQ